MKPRIIIEVSGGVVTGVYSHEPVDYDVLDRDNMKGCEKTGQEYKFYKALEDETSTMESFQ